jgi:hypothetical protein
MIKRSEYVEPPELTKISMKVPSIIADYQDEILLAKEECVKGILRQVLRREPMLIDAIGLVVVTKDGFWRQDGVIEEADVFLQHRHLGKILVNECEVVFEPSDEYDSKTK